MRTMRGKPVWVLVAMALLAAACGGDDGSAADGGTTTGVVQAPENGDGGADGDVEIDPDGTLRVATFAQYYWDPATQPSSYAITSLGLVYDRLVHTAPDGSLIPGLAESWEYTEDGLTLTFHLRDGVTFQDGQPFDAEAVRVNLDRSLTLEGSAVAAELGRIAEVAVVDPLTIELHLSEPDATLPAVLSGRAGAMISPAALDDPQLDQRPVGAGMFRLVEFNDGTSFAVERWDGYWDPDAVKVRRIEFSILPDTAARMNALRTSQVDIAPIEPGDAAEMDGVDGVSVRRNDTLRYVYLAMNFAYPPLDDLRVRQAISHAIDRQGLLDGPYFGYGTVAQQPWPAGYFPHVEGLDDTYPYDPDRARELLAEAGHPDGFRADIIAVPSPTVYALLAEGVQAQLAEVGIDLSIKLTESSALGDAMYVNKTAAFALLYTNGGIDPANSVGTRYSASGFFNPGGYSTPRLEELYARSLATTDEADRTQVMQDISREVVEQVLDMPLFFAQEPEVISDRVVGYESYVTGRPEFRGVAVAAS